MKKKGLLSFGLCLVLLLWSYDWCAPTEQRAIPQNQNQKNHFGQSRLGYPLDRTDHASQQASSNPTIKNKKNMGSNEGTSPKNRSQQKSSRLEQDADYADALTLMEQEKYIEAIPLLKKALKNRPDHIFIKADYVVCLVWTGAKQEAVDFFLKNREALQKLIYVSRNIARALYELSRYDEARKLYEQTLSANPTDNESLKGILYCLSSSGDYLEAHKRLETARVRARISPQNLALLEADIFRMEQKYKEAYLGYVELLLTCNDEDLLKELQDKRKAVFPLLPTDYLNKLLLQSIGNSAFYTLLLLDMERSSDFPQSTTLKLETLPLGVLLELAWGHFKAEHPDESLKIYQFIIKKWPASCLARIGSIYPLCAQKRFDIAQNTLSWVFKKGCFHLDALFAEAFIYEKQRNFLSAINIYKKILMIKPQNTSARKLKIRCLSDLGAISHAYDETLQQKITEQSFIEYLKCDLAVTRFKWAQTDQALPLLEDLLKNNPTNKRVRYDYIIALRNKERMQEVIEQFLFIEQNIEGVPFFVTEAAADAFLYQKNPQKALHYYKLSLQKKPEFPFNTLMGLFYAYQELRKWKEAEKTWKTIQDFTKKEKQLNQWLRLETFQSRGWYFAYQDKLEEAQHYFTQFINQAGMNSACRNALGYIYLWRGWPRLALEELKIAQNVDIKEFDASIQNGIAFTLNELNYKKQARALAKKLYRKFPRNKHVLDLVEALQIEDMNEFWFETRFVNESPGANEYWVKSTLTEPIVSTFKIFQEIIWQETSDDGRDYDWNRAGLGCEWIVTPEFIWKQAITLDYEDSDDFGYYTTIKWLPTDHFKITAGYDSFILDVPLRARAEGIEGENAFLDVYYHESDLRYYGFTLSIQWLDDGNRGSGVTLYYDQKVFNTPDMKIRLGGEFNYSTNSKQNVPYFSPLEGYTVALTQAIHYCHFHLYEKKFLSSLYTREGVYAQHGFKSYAIYGITYEQTIELTNTLAFIWNLAWDRKIYDGESTHVWSGFFGLKKKF